jgi:ABC-2 type transport system permease protein
MSLQWVFTLIVPIAFAGFYPAERLLSVTTLSLLAWLALPLGLVTFGVGAAVWHAGLARYQSTGS